MMVYDNMKGPLIFTLNGMDNTIMRRRLKSKINEKKMKKTGENPSGSQFNAD